MDGANISEQKLNWFPNPKFISQFPPEGGATKLSLETRKAGFEKIIRTIACKCGNILHFDFAVSSRRTYSTRSLGPAYKGIFSRTVGECCKFIRMLIFGAFAKHFFRKCFFCACLQNILFGSQSVFDSLQSFV